MVHLCQIYTVSCVYTVVDHNRTIPDNTDNKNFARDFYAEALSNELLLRPIGNTVYFMPPYIIDDSEAEFLVSGTIKTLHAVMKKL